MNGLVEKHDSCVRFGLSGLRFPKTSVFRPNFTTESDRSIILSLIRSYLVAVSQ